jgi:hypothetical protein
MSDSSHRKSSITPNEINQKIIYITMQEIDETLAQIVPKKVTGNPYMLLGLFPIVALFNTPYSNDVLRH